MKLHRILVGALVACCAFGARAQEQFVFMTNWYAQAEHGGFYQAVANGIYRKYGLDVTVKPGGPQVNIYQIMAAGQADCVMGASDLQVMIMRSGGVPVTMVASTFQKDPQVLIAHEDVKTFEDMKGKTILLTFSAQRTYWLWLKQKYGLTDNQTRPYTYNIQPFLLDANVVQQGFLTSEPFAIGKAGVKARTFLLADYGWSSYALTITCMDETLKNRGKAVAAFVKGTMEGWKSYLADPAPGNASIKKSNPNMTDEQLAYSAALLKEMKIVTGLGAATSGIGSFSEQRIAANYKFLLDNKLIDPAKVGPMDAYNLTFTRDLKVMP